MKALSIEVNPDQINGLSGEKLAAGVYSVNLTPLNGRSALISNLL